VERQVIRDSQRQKMNTIFREMAYNWKAVTYNADHAILYLVARSAPDYASLYRVLNEIKIRDPKFKPKNLFDFGSGIGMVTW
jgi:ribosomal protein RSM22 (predicted rRNA methylase)